MRMLYAYALIRMFGKSTFTLNLNGNFYDQIVIKYRLNNRPGLSICLYDLGERKNANF